MQKRAVAMVYSKLRQKFLRDNSCPTVYVQLVRADFFINLSHKVHDKFNQLMLHHLGDMPISDQETNIIVLECKKNNSKIEPLHQLPASEVHDEESRILQLSALGTEKIGWRFGIRAHQPF